MPTGNEEAEFCVYMGDRLVWARTFSVNPGLAGEVQKNLVLLGMQKPDLPEVQKIETTGIVGLGDLRVAKEPLEPWRNKDVKPQDPVAFLGALGLAEVAARSSTLPVNLAAPKEPKPVVDNFERRKKLGIIAAAILLPLLFGGFYWQISKMEREIKELQIAKDDVEDMLRKVEDEKRDVDALKEWQTTTISWLDDLYDIAARFPQEDGLRITSAKAALFNKQQIQANLAKGQPFTGAINVHGVMKKASQRNSLLQFTEAMQVDKKFVKTTGLDTKPDSFNLVIHVAPRPAAKYTAMLVAPAERHAAAGRGSDARAGARSNRRGGWQ